MSLSNRPPRTAQNIMLDLISRRDHSENELREKLEQKEFTAEDIEKAVHYALTNNLIRKPQELSQHVAQLLHQQKKGHLFINQTLEKRGLPPVDLDIELEKEKAIKALQIKLKGQEISELNEQQKGKLGRFLQTRGYPLDVIEALLYYDS